MSESVWNIGRMFLTGRNWSAWIETCPITALSTTNTARAGLGTKPDLLGKGLATDCLRRGTTQSFYNTFVQKSLVSVSP